MLKRWKVLSNGKRSFTPLTNFRQLCQLNEYQDVARADDKNAFPAFTFTWNEGISWGCLGHFPILGWIHPLSLRNENSPQIFALSDNELRKFRFSATTYFSDVTSSEFFCTTRFKINDQKNFARRPTFLLYFYVGQSENDCGKLLTFTFLIPHT